MTSTALECGVCSSRFSEDQNPRLLPCSHSLCVYCIEGIISTKNLTCPFCRKKFIASAAEDVTLNRDLLNVAMQLSSLDLGPKASSVTSSSTSGRKSFEDFNENFRNNFTKRALSACSDAKSKIVQAVGRLKKLNEDMEYGNSEICLIRSMLLRLEKDIYDNVHTIKVKTKLLNDRVHALHEEEQKIKRADESLQKAKDFASSRIILDKYESLFVRAHRKVEEIEVLLPETEEDVEKLVKNWIMIQRSLKHVADTIEERIEEDFHKIYVVKTFEGVKRVVPLRIGLRNTVTLMNQLKEEEEAEVPVNSSYIRLDSLMNKSPRRVFLDFGADGSFLGRMIITVRDDGYLAQNFLHMCAGDLGHSYQHSPIFSIANLGKPGESVCLGNYYEEAVGEGVAVSQPVLTEVNWAQESNRDIYKATQVKMGEVRGFFPRGVVSRFCIILRSDGERQGRDYIGEVEEGLTVLSDAIRIYPEYERIRIDNCGLVFTF
ncbi:uncharacterized protein [Palaemon carinicauda]|uniref:uncharacterized protein n=1 Tax=Palaemon carinicauda TaxID=392227 RepID=UPI0035B68C83